MAGEGKQIKSLRDEKGAGSGKLCYLRCFVSKQYFSALLFRHSDHAIVEPERRAIKKKIGAATGRRGRSLT